MNVACDTQVTASAAVQMAPCGFCACWLQPFVCVTMARSTLSFPNHKRGYEQPAASE